MRVLAVLMFALCLAVFAQQSDVPLASFAGTVREIGSTRLLLARQDQEDIEISVTHGTHYFDGKRKIKRDQIKTGDRVTVETKLDLYLKPEAVNVRRLSVEKP